MLHVIRLVLIAFALTSSTIAAQAQSYPNRPVRLIVAFVAGGATDIVARQISNELGEALGQPFIVENRPGAGGYIAWNFVASAEPDGYTLLVAENVLGTSQALYKKTQSLFDPVKQYDAIAGLAVSPQVLVVSNHVPANSVAELVALAKNAPQKMTYASAGIGTVAHLSFEVFRVGAGFDAMQVPYKGGGQAINDVIAGHVPMMITSIQVARGLVESGKVKGLAVTSRERIAILPNIPTLQEAGVKTAGMDLNFWFGLFGPAGIPEQVKTKLDNAIQTALNNPAMHERLSKLSIEPAYVPAAALKTKLRDEVSNWTRFIDANQIRPE